MTFGNVRNAKSDILISENVRSVMTFSAFIAPEDILGKTHSRATLASEAKLFLQSTERNLKQRKSER